MDGRRASWSAMETDCLAEIFRWVGLDDLVLSVPLVCKSWQAAASHPLCWKRLDFRQVDMVPWSRFAKSYATRHSLRRFSFAHLLKLAVGKSRNCVTELKLPSKVSRVEDLVFISNQCPELKSISLPIQSPKDEGLVAELVGKWKDLERLEMEYTPSNFPELLRRVGLNCATFSELVLTGTVREEDASAIVRHVPGIEKLDLSGSDLAKRDLLSIVRGCKQIRVLRVNGCIGFQEGDAEIRARVSGIREFDDKGSKLYWEGGTLEGSNGICLLGYVF